jgi:hypothetical protein
VRFIDSARGCWSRVDLLDGSPLYISAAKTGVLVKISRLGVFGPKLFKEEDVDRLARMCETINSQILSYSTPDSMKNPVLRLFTQIALDSASPSDFLSRLDRLLIPKCPESDGSYKREKLARFAEIVSEYGRVLEENSQMVFGVPKSKLPYKIIDIQEALIEIARDNLHNEDMLERLRTGFMLLGTFIDDEVAESNDKVRKFFQKDISRLPKADLTRVVAEMDMQVKMQDEIKQQMDKYLYVFDETLKKIP